MGRVAIQQINGDAHFLLRLLGDDARYIDRAGPTSPPFPNHEMKAGDKIRNDWFPVLYMIKINGK